MIGARAWVSLFVAAGLAAGCSKQAVPMPSSTLPSPSPRVAVSTSPVPTSSRAVDSSMADAVRSSAATTTTPEAATWTPVDGRPDPAQFKPVADLPDIHFEFDQSAVRPKTTSASSTRMPRGCARGRGALLVIEGHCDERGTSEYNIALGERRAKAAMDYLVSRDIDARRMTVISYGAQRPACVNHEESCWARNRRAHFVVKVS